MASNALECDVCCNVFSEENSPRILNCTHTFCGPCIDGIIATQKKTCPTCREEFSATSADDLMINRIALDVVKQLASQNVEPKTLFGGPQGSSLGFTKEYEGKLTKDSIADFRNAESKRLEEMKDVLAGIENLNEMREIVIDSNKGMDASMEKLQQIKLSNENTLDVIDQNIKWLMNRMNPYLQEVVKKNQELLQENKREREDILQEILKMKIRLGNISKDIEKLAEVDPLVVSAVTLLEGKQMVAPVRVKPGNQLRLSHFAEGDVPPESHVLKYEALMRTYPRRAFLDLAHGRRFLGRIVIRVMDEGNLALNFLHKCAGDLGPSYADSQLSSVVRMGQYGEHISVDKYHKSVLKLNWVAEGRREIYKSTPYKAGEVRGFLSEEDASKFYIVTRDGPNWNLNYCFGIVEEGLDTLRDAIEQFTGIRIVDCGLMLSE